MQLLGRLMIVTLLLAAALAAGACATAGPRGGNTVPRPRPFPGAPVPPEATELPPVDTAGLGEPSAPRRGEDALPSPGATQNVVSVALGYRGVPYRFGGSDPAGFDCSGFVQYVFKQVGSILPREVRDQVRVGRQVDAEDVRAGDLVFFQTVSNGASHVGLAIGGGEFVHAPSTNGVVRIERLTNRYWASRFLYARRIS